MKRLAVILIAGALVACGGDDSGTTDLPSIDAARDAAAEAAAEAGAAADAAQEAAAEAMESAGDAAAGAVASDLIATDEADAEAASCIQLVSQGEFAQAVPVCTAALAANPANQEVQDALTTARSEAGNLADAAAAASDAAQQGAQEAASDAAADAVGGLLGN